MCSGLHLDDMVVGLEVPLWNGQSKFGAGFLTNAPIFGTYEDASDPSGKSNVRVIVTAAHLLADSQGYALLTYPRDDRFKRIRLEPHPHPHNKPNSRSTVNPLALRTPDDRPLAGVFDWLFYGLPGPTNKMRGDEVGVLGIGIRDLADGNRTFHPTFAKGVISSVGPEGLIVRINAQGYKGLSGGVIFDRECDLVGMVVGENEKTGEIVAISDLGLEWLVSNYQTAFPNFNRRVD